MLVLFRVRQYMTTASIFARLQVKIPTLPWDPSEATGQRPTKINFFQTFFNDVPNPNRGEKSRGKIFRR